MIFRAFFQSDEARLKNFRCATKSDPSWQRLINRMFHDELVEVLNDPKRGLRAFVVEDYDGTIAGIVALEATDDHDWEVVAVGVSTATRRIGIARALIKFGVANSPAAKADAVLFTVHEGNHQMQSLVREFNPEYWPDPGSVDYGIYAAKPVVVIKKSARGNGSNSTKEIQRR